MYYVLLPLCLRVNVTKASSKIRIIRRWKPQCIKIISHALYAKTQRSRDIFCSRVTAIYATRGINFRGKSKALLIGDVMSFLITSHRWRHTAQSFRVSLSPTPDSNPSFIFCLSLSCRESIIVININASV